MEKEGKGVSKYIELTVEHRSRWLKLPYVILFSGNNHQFSLEEPGGDAGLALDLLPVRVRW